jgi:hypothetical protein
VARLVAISYARQVTSRDDDAWQAIVDNYGERPDLGPEEPAPQPPPAPEPEALPPELTGRDDAHPDVDWSQERYVPPPPPPIPPTTRDRLLAWLGVFGSPAVLLISLVLGIELPGIVAYALVTGFVGGFLYLVWKMPRGPRDPNDDGAVL